MPQHGTAPGSPLPSFLGDLALCYFAGLFFPSLQTRPTWAFTGVKKSEDVDFSLSTITLLETKILSFVRTNTKENLFRTIGISVKTIAIGERGCLYFEHTETAGGL